MNNPAKPSTTLDDTSKISSTSLWSALTLPWQLTTPWLRSASDISNNSKPSTSLSNTSKITVKDNSANIAGVSKFGGDGDVRSRAASKFVASTNLRVNSAILQVNKDTGTPSGNALIRVYTNNSGVPSSTQVGGTITITPSEMSDSFTQFDKTFSSPIDLSIGETYWVVFMVATLDQSDIAYYSTRGITNGSTNNGAKFNEDDSGIWVNNDDDLFYILKE